MNRDLDRWPIRDTATSLLPLKGFTEVLGLSDLWRVHNPNTKQYTFHSGAHGSMSRIDHLLVHSHQIQDFNEVCMLARGISDHSPLWATLVLTKTRNTGRIVINPWYLKIPKVRG